MVNVSQFAARWSAHLDLSVTMASALSILSLNAELTLTAKTMKLVSEAAA